MKRLPARLLQLLTAALAIASLLAIASACGGDAAPATPTPAATQATQPATTAAPSPTPTTPAAATPTTTAPTVAVAACPQDFVALGSVQMSTGAAVISVTFSTAAGGPRCTYSGPVSVRLLDSGGVPLLGMAENPVTATVNGDTATFTWRNWCAAPGTFRAAISAGKATPLVGIPGPPSCTAPKDKSSLTLATP